MLFRTRFWLRICIINLVLVALLGVLMRYKIAFSFPYLDQKHLQHAHSHFAFIGWLAQTLFVLIIDKLQKNTLTINVKRYQGLLVANVLAAYGMLITFAIQGYGVFSIGFSTLSVLIAYSFCYFIHVDLKAMPDAVFKPWFNAALFFNVLSSIGTFALAYMMAGKNVNTNLHLAALYFYLHFQYNGFFTFASIGLLSATTRSILPDLKNKKLVFSLFFYACFPAYLLSILWAKLSGALMSVVVLAAMAQVLAWILLLLQVRAAFKLDRDFLKKWRVFFYVIAIAVSAKYLLQLGSTVPAISKLAFGFRAIVVAYLHLILLAIISAFLVVYMFAQELLPVNRLTVIGLFGFVGAVYINELLLGTQGIAALDYIQIPFINEQLFGIALLIVVALGIIVAGAFRTSEIEGK